MLGSVVLMVFFAWPEYTELREAMKIAEVRETDLENFRNYHQTIEAMMGELETDYRQDVQKMQDGIPDDHYIPSLFAELRRISYRTGVRIDGFGEFSEVQFLELPEINGVEVSFNAEGAYPNFKNFISELESSARIINITNLRIERTRGQDVDQTLNYSVRLLTYSY